MNCSNSQLLSRRKADDLELSICTMLTDLSSKVYKVNPRFDQRFTPVTYSAEIRIYPNFTQENRTRTAIFVYAWMTNMNFHPTM